MKIKQKDQSDPNFEPSEALQLNLLISKSVKAYFISEYMCLMNQNELVNLCLD